jgi:hypothetical protein
MGMSTEIMAFMPDTDLEFQKHKKILLMCIDAEVSLPKETAEYFGDNEDPELWMLDEKLELELLEGVHYTEYSENSSEGFEIDLSKLPKGIAKLRFTNSY